MKGVVYLGESEVEVRDFEQPEPGVGQVVIESKIGGLCGSDRACRGGPRADSDQP